MRVSALAVLVCATGCRAIFGLDDPAARTDGPPDQKRCWGSAFEICVPTPPAELDDLRLDGVVDTSTSQLCEASITPNCVIAANTLTVGNAAVTGGRPLVLIAADAIIVEVTLDAASHPTKPGPASMGASCNAFAAAPAMGLGGGAGGTLAGVGGIGGRSIPNNAMGGEPAPIVAINGLRAGCAGQDGGGAATHMGFGGRGGGAAYLIAGRSIDVRDGASINASGAGGGGALCTGDCGTPMNGEAGGGGGGGSGGMLILEAPSIASNGVVFADGGGGGEGASGSNGGRPGADPDGSRGAPGGTGGASNGGNGGDGSHATVASGGRGEDVTSSLSPPGGGGGGGGAGVIHIYGTAGTGIVGGTSSPPPELR